MGGWKDGWMDGIDFLSAAALILRRLRPHQAHMLSQVMNPSKGKIVGFVNLNIYWGIPICPVHCGWAVRESTPFTQRPLTVSGTDLNNSSPPSAAYMRQWIGSALAQIMACRHSAPSHYLNQCWVIVNWTVRNKLQWKLNGILSFSFKKMHLKMSSARMAAILSRGRWVNIWQAICLSLLRAVQGDCESVW